MIFEHKLNIDIEGVEYDLEVKFNFTARA